MPEIIKDAPIPDKYATRLKHFILIAKDYLIKLEINDSVFFTTKEIEAEYGKLTKYQAQAKISGIASPIGVKLKRKFTTRTIKENGTVKGYQVWRLE